MIDWPDSLVQDIARRRAVLFLGAGVSRNASSATDSTRHPPTWLEFLQHAVERCSNPNRHIKSLLTKGDYLTACEVVKHKLQDEWNRLIHDEFVAPRFVAAAIHKNIFKIDSRIVLTQHVDKIYDAFASSESSGTVYVKDYSQADVALVVRGDRRCILKAHGTVDSPDEMVFTRAEYLSARFNFTRFYSLLDALAVTHTFLFIGCGLSDPDVRLMLERHAHSFPSTRPHFMISPKGSVHVDEQESIRRNMSLKMLMYKPDNNHKFLSDSIEALVALVEAERNNLVSTRDW